MNIEHNKSFVYNFLKYSKQKMGKIRRYECHICQKSDGRIKVVCSIERCSLAFCIQCIKKNFDQNFQSKNYKRQYWICYACGKMCKCNMCRGVLPHTKIKKIKKNLKHSEPIRTETAIIDEEKVQHGKLEETVTQFIFPKKSNAIPQQKINSKDIILNKNQYRKRMLLQISSIS